MRTFSYIALLVGFLLFSFACRQEGSLTSIPYDPQPVSLEKPDRFVPMAIPAGNPLTREGIALGRRLFYDPILSADSSMSCAGCHLPEKAFTDGETKSTGIAGKSGKRSALSLANVGYYYKGLFWDGRTPSLEEQALIPVEDSLELAHDWGTVAHKLRRHPEYPGLFRKAFGIDHKNELTKELAAKAIAQFERTLVSYNARYDRVMQGEEAFSPAEKRGFEIFFDASSELPFSECGHCHIDPLFTNLGFFNNGIEPNQDLDSFPDQGRGGVSGRRYERGMFRVPTLRNIELTAPYMHDGRFETLGEVIDHYISGGHYGDNVNPNVRRLAFTKTDKEDLIAFLRTLTDTSFINNPAIADPFAESNKEESL